MSIDLRLLAARVARGDASAFRQIVDHTRAPLYRLAARMLGNLADAEDVLQEAYVNAFRGLSEGRYDGRSKLETYLHRIVVNASTDALRKRRESPKEVAREPRFDGRVPAEARLALRELDALLQALAPQDRAALVLVSLEGMSAREAGEVLGCSEGAIEQRLVRARAALRQGHGEEVRDG
ncbi:RNA polymerase sigma factor [Chondromyces apiculatus]|uniref:ECF-family RNA polymerase sigma factor n=1 Tax=Chondromyces apiculatus DSM 436 TaxID=1192034 RepID=A0A017T9T0_9BACT|nr:RNA polymerase sigma factor [Chondromyces apiculatus]EYF05692.1 ECF-family RNA polymerase sigma factor [Chondromyces apiculatus DSM 436]